MKWPIVILAVLVLGWGGSKLYAKYTDCPPGYVKRDVMYAALAEAHAAVKRCRPELDARIADRSLDGYWTELGWYLDKDMSLAKTEFTKWLDQVAHEVCT